MGDVLTFRRYIYLDDICALARCLETGPHRHPVCGMCGAIDWGNVFGCASCRREMNKRWKKQYGRELLSEPGEK